MQAVQLRLGLNLDYLGDTWCEICGWESQYVLERVIGYTRSFFCMSSQLKETGLVEALVKSCQRLLLMAAVKRIITLHFSHFQLQVFTRLIVIDCERKKEHLSVTEIFKPLLKLCN